MMRKTVHLALAAVLLTGSGVAVSCASHASSESAAVTLAAPHDRLRPAAIRVGKSVWTNVSVATLWTSPAAPRGVDGPALRAPVDIPRWLAAMSTASRRDLVGRVETQSLLGERLVVTGIRNHGGLSWVHVVAVDQASHRDSRGYPGWLPARQVTTTAPATARRIATVIRPTAWLHDKAGNRRLRVSIATRLPVVSTGATTVTVTTPRHALRTINATAVVVRRSGAAALTKSPAAAVTTARSFLGLPYLWGGRSGFAVDCSGFTQLVLKLHGVNVPRDADDQAAAGRAITISKARAGDLVFFGRPVSHVGLVVKPGRMEHAPNSGSFVQMASIASVGSPVAARRYF